MVECYLCLRSPVTIISQRERSIEKMEKLQQMDWILTIGYVVVSPTARLVCERNIDTLEATENSVAGLAQNDAREKYSSIDFQTSSGHPIGIL